MAAAIRALLRGVAQVDLVGSAWTGLAFVAALFAADWRVGAYALVGTAAATGAALLLGADRSAVERGLEGYSGCLTGIAGYLILGANPASVVVVVFGGAVCTVLTAALSRLLRGIGLPVLTAPFCVVAEVLAMGSSAFGHVRAEGAGGTPPPFPIDGGTRLSALDAGRAFCANIAEVFLLDQWYVGLIMLVGLLIASRIAAAAAAAGSAVAVLLAWALGAPAEQITAGLYGYNAVLSAIALAATFLVLTPSSAAYTLLGVIFATVLTAAAGEALTPLHGHAYTWPFVLTTWLFMAAVPTLTRIRRRTPEPATEPAAEPAAAPEAATAAADTTAPA
ncbi:urea transporter, partial [Streptomyces sp. SID3343]|uniref:urea transporter n=1 Tax=Streptomyces sp. SID3343 TaxID=2690260 RepID=UPI001367BED3